MSLPIQSLTSANASQATACSPVDPNMAHGYRVKHWAGPQSAVPFQAIPRALPRWILRAGDDGAGARGNQTTCREALPSSSGWA